MNETILGSKEPYAIITVDVDREGERNTLLTLHTETKAEWYALFARLIVYGHKEEHLVKVERSPEFVNLETIEEERKALEWRLAHINEIFHAALKEG
jgi:hypothetical protein